MHTLHTHCCFHSAHTVSLTAVMHTALSSFTLQVATCALLVCSTSDKPTLLHCNCHHSPSCIYGSCCKLLLLQQLSSFVDSSHFTSVLFSVSLHHTSQMHCFPTAALHALHALLVAFHHMHQFFVSVIKHCCSAVHSYVAPLYQ
jgi:hypothetical protein